MKSGATIVMPIQAIQALERGSKIEAIKLLRESSGMGLKESKEAVEVYLDANPIIHERLQQAAREKGGSSMWVAGVVFLLGVLLWVKMADQNEGLNFKEFFNKPLFETSEPKDSRSVVIDSKQKLFYPQDAEAAVALYNKYSLQRAATARDLSYQELVNDSLKIQYLVTHDAIKSYEKYLGYKSHKAFAVSGAGNYGYSGSDRINLEFAIEEALTYCKKYMESYSAKQCYIIDINGVFLGSDQ